MEPEQEQNKSQVKPASFNWKVVIPVVLVIVVIFVAVLYFMVGQNNTAVAPSTNSSTTGNSAAQVTSGNVDDITSQAIQDATDEQSTYNNEGSDKSLVNNDSKEMNNFDQAYNENGF